MEADFSGYATKAGLKCSDGRTITAQAFKDMDGKTVPLLYQHGHKDPLNVLGHAKLTVKDDGVWTEAYFNESATGKHAKEMVRHGDITMMSIHAHSLIEQSKQVLHGVIKEVSLVLQGANPGATIDPLSIRHSDGEIEDLDGEAIIYTGLAFDHAGEASDDEATVQDVLDSMTEEQRNVVNYLVGEALSDEDSSASQSNDDSESSDESAEHTDDHTDEDTLDHQEGSDMTRNVFEKNGDAGDTKVGGTLTHEQFSTIFEEGAKGGSFKEALLNHADEYGITNIDVLFPDAKAIDTRPEWITRKIEWVEGVLNGARKVPFSKIKSLSADLTHEEARAKGYIKATMKKEQFFAIAKRETGPKTIYKKQKLDRDDLIDMTEFDVVAWLWVEMRFMLREEIARAVLIGDGREVDDPDKISETNIRPIARDDSFYTDVVVVPTNTTAKSYVEAVLRARPNYKGKGGLPTAYITEEALTDMLLLKDGMGRFLYDSEASLASKMRVRNFVTVPVLEGASTDDGEILMVLVSMSDYTIGSTKGGEVTTFEDFDLDWNQHKYLIEGRMSGALTGHKTAQVIVRATGGTMVTPEAPTFVPATGVVTIPSVTGVSYTQDGVAATAGAQTAIAAGAVTEVVATPDVGYYFPHNTDADWEFIRDEA